MFAATPTTYVEIIQLCRAINDWTATKYSHEQYKSLSSQLEMLTEDLNDVLYRFVSPEITTARNQLKQWSADYAVSLAKAMEARYA